MRGWLDVSRPVRILVALLLWGLLAGYLILNKPFAKLGFGPFYIGEMVLACALLSLLGRLKETFLEALNRSFVFWFIAAFWLYGLVRALAGYPEHGWWALRDSVVACYSLVAFVAPAVLWVLVPVPGPEAKELIPSAESRGSASPRHRDAMLYLPRHVVLWLLALASLGALWAAVMLFGWINQDLWLDTKADFLALATAVAAWVWAIAAVRASPWQRRMTGGDVGQASSLSYNGGARTVAFIGAVTLALEAFFLVRALPTRTMWLVVGPLALLIVAAWAYTRTRRRMFLAGCLALLCAAAFALRGLPRFFSQFDQEFALAQNLDFSSDELEVHLRQHPDNFPKLVLNRAMGGGERAGKERWQSLFAPDESKFETEQGRVGAHAVKWRAVFWLRCWHYVVHRAPVLGVGFGANLTNLLRNTAAWPMYIDGMRLDPPNRTPHCAHVTIFARLGLLGLGLWLVILASVLWNVLRACWQCRKLASSQGLPRERAEAWRLCFWDGLAILGVWIIYLWAMTFGVVLEGPIGGIWFWALTGILAWWSKAVPDVIFETQKRMI